MTSGVLPNGVAWERTTTARVTWYGRGERHICRMAVSRYFVRLPGRHGDSRDVPPTVADLVAAAADPGVLFDALLDVYPEAWELVP